MAESKKSESRRARARPGEKAASPPKARVSGSRAPSKGGGARASAPRAKPRGSPSGRRGTRRKGGPAAAPLAGSLNEEDQIRSAKFLPRDLPPRLFEEERFLFPESYGVNRVRLLVKDPEWLFAHWDVDPKTLESLKRAMGERAMALARLTLRVVDPANGGASDILLPPGARGWYIRADQTRRSYKAELGVTLPSGEFRRLAESNVVVTPRVGPSRERAQRRITFGQAGRIPKEAGLAQREQELRDASGAGPWRAASIDGAQPAAGTTGAGRPSPRGGASEAFRPGGASDVYRR